MTYDNAVAYCDFLKMSNTLPFVAVHVCLVKFAVVHIAHHNVLWHTTQAANQQLLLSLAHIVSYINT